MTWKLSALLALGAACAILAPLPGALAGETAMAQTRDLAAEEANRLLVTSFYERFFGQHDLTAAELVADTYKQHNPNVPDGKAPFVSFFTGAFAKNPQLRSRVVRSGTFGDLVYLHVHSVTGPDDRGRAIVDIFRVQDGKIVEHWDVIQPVPEKSANSNGMF